MKLFRLFCLSFLALTLCAWQPIAPETSQHMLVMGTSLQQTSALVQSINGVINRNLEIIDGVEASLTARQITYLRSQGLEVFPNVGLSTAGSMKADTFASDPLSQGVDPAEALGIDDLHIKGLDGRGVTVAVVDSGLDMSSIIGSRVPHDDILSYRDKNDRFIIYRDFIGRSWQSKDAYGHGTHVINTIAGDLPYNPTNDPWQGVAPRANLVVARALDGDGNGTYADTIDAIGWIVQNKDRYNIRVLNLSLLAEVQSLYWKDPLNRAVMEAWKSNIVVVTAAGNTGPDSETISVPGNVPYVITVGAFRSADVSTSKQDEITEWSSRGPTTDSGFVKPDVLAPGVRIVSLLPLDSKIAKTTPDARVKGRVTLAPPHAPVSADLYQLSGTSMATAEMSGLAALLLQKRPDLTNDQVKWLMGRTASVAVDSASGNPSYSIWEQGSGRVNAEELFGYRGKVDSSNEDMNISLDLRQSSRGQHYIGMTDYNAQTGLYSIPQTNDTTSVYFNWCGTFTDWPGSTTIGSCSASGTPSTPSNGGVWSGKNPVWSGKNPVWSGKNPVWSGITLLWKGSDS